MCIKKLLTVSIITLSLATGTTALAEEGKTFGELLLDALSSTETQTETEPEPVRKTLWASFHTEDIQKEFNDNKAEAEKNVYKFTDINENDWYIDYITRPMFYSVLDGYNDGTLRPNNSISVAEVAKVVAAAYESGLTNGGTVDNGAFGDNWFNNYYKAIAKAFTYDSSNKMTVDYMNSAMRRCEVAYVLASISDDGSLQSYIDKANAGDISQMSGFSDFKNIATDADGTLAKDQEIMNAGWIPARYAGAIMYMNAKGIMQGDGETMGALDNVTRAQMFKLIQETCKISTSYTTAKFYGEVYTAPTTTTDGSSQSSNYAPTGGVNTINPTHDRNMDNSGWVGTDSTGVRETYDEWQSRPNITASWDDTSRLRLKVGDTFIAQDGTAYLLEGSGIYMPDGKTEIAGVGLPIATDLGRSYQFRGKTLTITNHWKGHTDLFGWISSTLSTKQDKYIVISTGEGHWGSEWKAIIDAFRPTDDGTDGQYDSSGYWRYWDETGWITTVRGL